MNPIYTFIPELPNIPSFKIKQSILVVLQQISDFLTKKNFQSTLIFDDYYLKLFDTLFTPSELTLMRFVLKEKLNQKKETSTKIFAIYVCQNTTQNIDLICQDFRDPETKKIPSLEQVKQIREKSTCCFQINRWYNTYKYRGMFILTDQLISESKLEETGLSNVLSGQFEINGGYYATRLNYIQIDNRQKEQQNNKDNINQDNKLKHILDFLKNQNIQTLKVYRTKFDNEHFEQIAQSIQENIPYNQQIPEHKQNYLFMINRNQDPLQIFNISQRFGPLLEQFADFYPEKACKQIDKQDQQNNQKIKIKQSEKIVTVEESSIIQALNPRNFLNALQIFNQAQQHIHIFGNKITQIIEDNKSTQQSESEYSITLTNQYNDIGQMKQIIFDKQNVNSLQLQKDKCIIQFNSAIMNYHLGIDINKSKVMMQISDIEKMILDGTRNIRNLRNYQNWTLNSISNVKVEKYLQEESRKSCKNQEGIRFSYALYLTIQVAIACALQQSQDKDITGLINKLIGYIQNENIYVGDAEAKQKLQYLIRDIVKYVNKNSNGDKFYCSLLREYILTKENEGKSTQQQTQKGFFSSKSKSPNTEEMNTKNQVDAIPSLVEMITYFIINQREDIINKYFYQQFNKANQQFMAIVEEGGQISYTQYYNYCRAVQQKDSIAGKQQLDEVIRQYEQQYDKTKNGATSDEIAAAQYMSQRQLAEIGFFNIGQISSNHEIVIISDNIISAKQFILNIVNSNKQTQQ